MIQPLPQPTIEQTEAIMEKYRQKLKMFVINIRYEFLLPKKS